MLKDDPDSAGNWTVGKLEDYATEAARQFEADFGYAARCTYLGQAFDLADGGREHRLAPESFVVPPGEWRSQSKVEFEWEIRRSSSEEKIVVSPRLDDLCSRGVPHPTHVAFADLQHAGRLWRKFTDDAASAERAESILTMQEFGKRAQCKYKGQRQAEHCEPDPGNCVSIGSCML